MANFLQHTPAIYQILTRQAINQQPITYGDIAEEIGIARKGNNMIAIMNDCLSHIFHWCVINKQPHLTSLAVRKDTMRPGIGFWKLLFAVVPTKQEQQEILTNCHNEVYQQFAALSNFTGVSLHPFIEKLTYEYSQPGCIKTVEVTINLPGCELKSKVAATWGGPLVTAQRLTETMLTQVAALLNSDGVGVLTPPPGIDLAVLRAAVITDRF